MSKRFRVLRVGPGLGGDATLKLPRLVYSKGRFPEPRRTERFRRDRFDCTPRRVQSLVRGHEFRGRTYLEALAVFAALWRHASHMNEDFPGDWQADIAADVELARVLNGCRGGR
jgi:hypothetical protein